MPEGRQKIRFRADASAVTGYGHFVRSMALADMLKDEFDCVFHTVDPGAFQRKEASSVCPLVALPSDGSADRVFLDSLEGGETVVLDNYFFTAAYEAAIRAKGCRLVRVDDLHDRAFDADAIVSHCLADPSQYVASGPDIRLCLGPRWALLRRPFLSGELPSRRRYDFLVTFGGSDKYGLTGRYVAYLRSLLPQCRIAALVGEGFSGDAGDADVYRSLPAGEVAGLMRDSRAVVCSASSVCYEALACGCNVFAAWYVDNQKDFYETLSVAGAVVPIGNPLLSGIDFDPGAEISPRYDFGGVPARYRSLFAGLGYRIVPYPSMTVTESRKVWQARNDDSIRCRMTNPDKFSFESHCGFVERLKDSADRLFYAFFDGDDFVGSYDCTDIRDGKAERGLYVAPGLNHRGIGSMMELTMETMMVARGITEFTASVLKSNTASLNFHEKMGYSRSYEDDRFVHYVRRLI